MQNMTIQWFEELDSTNNAILAERVTLSDKTVFATHFQSAGKGQRGNSWESARGENLTFSILLKPDSIKAGNQFLISEAVTVGIAEYLDIKGADARIKWPNDIYVGDKKLCGILIECGVASEYLSYCVVGVGININQTIFVSDAPNPVSLAQLTGKHYDIEQELVLLLNFIEKEYDSAGEETQKRFLDRLYRKNEWHNYIDCTTGIEFKGKIKGIDSAARLRVELENGLEQVFAFKEIAYRI